MATKYKEDTACNDSYKNSSDLFSILLWLKNGTLTPLTETIQQYILWYNFEPKTHRFYIILKNKTYKMQLELWWYFNITLTMATFFFYIGLENIISYRNAIMSTGIVCILMDIGIWSINLYYHRRSWIS